MSPLQVNPFTIVADVGDVLDSLGVRYVVVGSMASIAFGQVRTTADADLLAELGSGHVAEFVQLVSTAFDVDEMAVRAAVSNRRSFNLIHSELLFTVDVFSSRGEPFDRAQLDRRRRTQISLHPPREAWLATPEDTVLAKLVWFRKGNDVSERQWRDVLGILKVQGERLDAGYMRRWASTLAVDDLLERAMVAARS